MSDPDWLGDLYERHAGPLYRYFLGATRRQTDARDLLQDLFVKIARNPGCLDGIENTRSYVFRIAHNQVVDWSRRIKARRDTASEPIEENRLFAASSDPDVKQANKQIQLLSVAEREKMQQ